MEEVITGYNILLDAKNKKPIPGSLPAKTWSGMQTISDDVLLRIIAVSKDEKPYRQLHPIKIRTQCKNYFEFIVGNFNYALDRKVSLEPFFYGSGDKYDESAKGVLDMLKYVKKLLEQDAASKKPKG